MKIIEPRRMGECITPPAQKKMLNVVYIIMLEYKTFSKYSTV